MEQMNLNGHHKVVLGASVMLQIEPEGEIINYRLVNEKDADIPAGYFLFHLYSHGCCLGEKKVN